MRLLSSSLSFSPSCNSIACLDEIETLPLYANHSPKKKTRKKHEKIENNDSMIDCYHWHCRHFFPIKFPFFFRPRLASLKREKEKPKSTNSFAKLEPDWEFKISSKTRAQYESHFDFAVQQCRVERSLNCSGHTSLASFCEMKKKVIIIIPRYISLFTAQKCLFFAKRVREKESEWEGKRKYLLIRSRARWNKDLYLN